MGVGLNAKLGEDEAARLHREAFARAGVETQIATVPIPVVDATGDIFHAIFIDGLLLGRTAPRKSR